MTRRRLTITAVVLLLVVAPLTLLSYVAFTASGLQFVVSKIPRRIGRAQIEITPPRGTLVGGFEVDRVEIDHDRSHLIFQGIQGRLATLPLLWQTVDGRELIVRNAFIQVRRRTQPSATYTPRFLPPGLVVRVTDAHVDSLTLIASNGRRYDTTNVTASGVVRNRSMRFYDSSFDWEAMHVTGSTKLEAAIPMRISGAARMTIAWPKQPVWTIDTTAKGDLSKLGFTGAITTPFRADFTGEARDLTTRWNWSGESTVHDFDL